MKLVFGSDYKAVRGRRLLVLAAKLIFRTTISITATATASISEASLSYDLLNLPINYKR
jgi:hypothetical protein